MKPATGQLAGVSRRELQGRAPHYDVHRTRPDGTPNPLEECPRVRDRTGRRHRRSAPG